MAQRLTIPETVTTIERRFAKRIPVWKLRRVVDAMESGGSLDVQRIGNYRTVSQEDVCNIVAQLQELGWLPLLEDLL